MEAALSLFDIFARGRGFPTEGRRQRNTPSCVTGPKLVVQAEGSPKTAQRSILLYVWAGCCKIRGSSAIYKGICLAYKQNHITGYGITANDHSVKTALSHRDCWYVP
jgi:hypothetical protein